MKNDKEGYKTSEAASILDMPIPTVRKYSQSLEKGGYVFQKGKGKGKYESRLFMDNDIVALRYLKQLREKSNLTVDEAVAVVVYKHQGAIHKSVSETSQDELKALIHKQNELIEGLSQRIDKQQRYIDQSLRDIQEQLKKKNRLFKR